jgi:hypothetical protein
MENFYCQQKCGEVDFSIEEWNKSYKEINAMPISEEEKQKLIDGEPCKEQCFACMAIVGETQRKNRLIRESKTRDIA